METLEALSRRIDTAGDLRDLVRTMKALSAVSIRQYERSIAALASYDRTIDLGLRAVLRGAPPATTRHRIAGRTAALVLGSDQGLCGTFNEQVVQRVLADLERGALVREGLRLLVVGARAADRLAEGGLTPDHQVPVPASAALLPSLVQDLLLVLDQWRAGHDVTEAVLYYNRPTGTMASAPHRERLLPIAEDRLDRLRHESWPTRMLPLRTVEPARLLRELARQSLFVTLHRALAWSCASEHGSRLVAMQAAEHNIEERLELLRSAYHSRRQTAITSEVLDIVAGAEALAS